MTPVTTVDITDPVLLARLASTSGVVVFRGPNRECVRLAELVPADQLPPGLRPPISDEEFEKLRQQPDSGVTLDEFWKRVKSGEWR